MKPLSATCIVCHKKRNGYFRGNRCRKCAADYARTWALDGVIEGRTPPITDYVRYDKYAKRKARLSNEQ